MCARAPIRSGVLVKSDRSEDGQAVLGVRGSRVTGPEGRRSGTQSTSRSYELHAAADVLHLGRFPSARLGVRCQSVQGSAELFEAFPRRSSLRIDRRFRLSEGSFEKEYDDGGEDDDDDEEEEEESDVDMGILYMAPQYFHPHLRYPTPTSGAWAFFYLRKRRRVSFQKASSYHAIRPRSSLTKPADRRSRDNTRLTALVAPPQRQPLPARNRVPRWRAGCLLRCPASTERRVRVARSSRVCFLGARSVGPASLEGRARLASLPASSTAECAQRKLSSTASCDDERMGNGEGGTQSTSASEARSAWEEG
ncbi:hypothetical protein HPB51_000954 [Rhipicephalus microplus]|uniref:Uncharacterized protein n=1 Tax=Rhipicephalus microplus TaxID=6941 RepID=A0A9J6DL29_RHIMP|nr:hypothetical protein HPB51_000954 [Rhipicephalus microplus]